MSLSERTLLEAAGQSVNPDHVYLRAAADHLADQIRPYEDAVKGQQVKVDKAKADLAAAKASLTEAKSALSDAKSDLELAERAADAAEAAFREASGGDSPLTGSGGGAAFDATVQTTERG